MANHSVQRKGSHSEGLIPRIFSSKTPTNTLKVPLNTSAAAINLRLGSHPNNRLLTHATSTKEIIFGVPNSKNPERATLLINTRFALVTSRGNGVNPYEMGAEVWHPSEALKKITKW